MRCEFKFLIQILRDHEMLVSFLLWAGYSYLFRSLLNQRKYIRNITEVMVQVRG